MADHSELIAQFISLTNSSTETAEFYLNATNYDIDAAVEQYYTSQAEDPTSEDIHSDLVDSQEPQASSSQGFFDQSTSQTSKPASRFRSLADLNSENEDEEKKGQNVYTGGEKSGTMVNLPPDFNPETGNLLDSILKQATENAANMPERAAGNSPPRFQGHGYRLDAPSAPQQPSTSQSSQPSENNEPVERSLTVYRNGILFGEDRFLPYGTEEATKLLQSIESGVAPRELMGVSPGQHVDLKLSQKTDEDYTPPKLPMKSFSGQGQRLGSPLPTVASSSSAPKPASNSQNVTHEVDPSLPQTSIQFRLMDGTRKVVKFNHSNTVGDLRGFLSSSTPDISFTINTQFPNRVLEDDSQTLTDAGLLNCVIIQKRA
ncbi:hypothetical protein CONCODRAFT_78224 [Conidiobolus coronatus NRRL 28638]|uniref:SEP-domain-containing protein n=1 Tax=Conidiobolus coronatus (strain ATCC 28846 / CBS 209.66 / NRRL 28638) TaxID=796925 RepID=A0A137P9J4_CONC2|nr:hypothetical protein CONCODRAFT_78224 [Conidiobolus coronatus NRRL 28638]|eukprot:KXN71652.1 hypothetical protein CONCODRAFT_78224 [Conidiobolus coronatus NRRL 28638]